MACCPVRQHAQNDLNEAVFLREWNDKGDGKAMASVNKVILIGNLGRDPEIRYAASGSAICNVTLATSRQWKDRNTGERQEETEWHRVVFYDRLAEVAGEYLKKGSPCYVEGRLKTRKWQDKDGMDRYTTEIVAESMQMLGSRGDAAGGSGYDGGYAGRAPQAGGGNRPAAQQQRQAPAAPAGTGFDDMDDDIPF